MAQVVAVESAVRMPAFRAGLNLTTIPPWFGQTGVRFWHKP
jgi:hypothetical protein